MYSQAARMARDWVVRRTLHPQDDSAIEDVMAEAALAAYASIFPRATRVDLEKGTATWFQGPPPLGTFAVDDDGTMVGTISAYKIGPREALIEGFYVRPSYHRRQVGRALWDRVLRVLKDSGYTEVDLWVLEANDQARAVYKHLGCELDPTATGSMTVGSQSARGVRYRVPLPP
jgi:ribosomal protein S18 acetylase RimI-like enzyme